MDQLADDNDAPLAIESGEQSIVTGALSVGAPVENKKMTRAQRNKQGRLKERERQLEAHREAKRRQAQENRVDAIAGEVKTIVAQQKKRADKNAVARAQKATAPARLGPQKYKNKVLAVEVPLTEELSGSLRRAKVKGSLLHDHMQSLHRRNIVEPRKLVGKRRRYRLKTYITKAGKVDG